MKRFMVVITLLVLPLAGATLAPAATYYILPDGTGDAPTIQAGLDLCVPGDMVLVAEGTYFENLVWPAVDGIELVSEYGVETTGIDGLQLGSVILIASGVGPTTRIEGFTIRNGLAENGGGILCRASSSPTITGNTVIENQASDLGGGIACLEASAALIIDNTITHNSITVFGWTGGSGVGASEASPRIYGNLITHNSGGGGGGGIQIGTDSSARVVNNTIEHNSSYFGGGVLAYHCTGYIAYNTVRWNIAEADGGGVNCWNSKAEILHNEISFNAAYGPDGGGGISCIEADSSLIDGCLITNNMVAVGEGGGIECVTETAPIIRNCTIADNEGCGIFCKKLLSIPGVPGGNPLIINNNITGHPQHGVCNTDDRLMIDARLNWWGDASGPGGSGPGTGDAVNEYVRYEPWATEYFDVTVGVDPRTPPAGTELAQNWPNPFNPLTRIQFSVPVTTPVQLTVHDVRGRLVATLVDRTVAAGRHEVVWQASDDAGRPVAAGAYFYVLRTDRGTMTRKMCVVK